MAYGDCGCGCGGGCAKSNPATMIPAGLGITLAALGALLALSFVRKA